MDSSSISLPLPGSKDGSWRIDVPMRSFQGGASYHCDPAPASLINTQSRCTRILPQPDRDVPAARRRIRDDQFYLLLLLPLQIIHQRIAVVHRNSEVQFSNVFVSVRMTSGLSGSFTSSRGSLVQIDTKGLGQAACLGEDRL